MAAYQGNLELVEFLVDKGADVNARDEAGKTVLMFALDDQLDRARIPTALWHSATNDRTDRTSTISTAEKGILQSSNSSLKQEPT